MSVNGIEIKVGQTWETRGDGIAVVASDSKTHPLCMIAVKGRKTKFNTSDSSWSVSENGRCNIIVENPGDLIKLIGDVQRDEPMTFTPPPTVTEVDANALAAETLKSLGWVFVANAWVCEKPLPEASALDTQVGGDHYKDCGIQPVEYIHANDLGYVEGNVIKYVTRHSKKNGAADLKKAIHYLQIALQQQYGEDSK